MWLAMDVSRSSWCEAAWPSHVPLKQVSLDSSCPIGWLEGERQVVSYLRHDGVLRRRGFKYDKTIPCRNLLVLMSGNPVTARWHDPSRGSSDGVFCAQPRCSYTEAKVKRKA